MEQLTLKQFGDTIKNKYPEYSGYDSLTIGKKMLEKYPQYSSKVNKSNFLTDSKTGKIPVIKQATQLGVGIGTELAKAGLGLGQTFLKGANLVSRGLGMGNQYDPLISGIEKIKQDVYTKPFQQEKESISGKIGTGVGVLVPFIATGRPITSSQSFLKGVVSEGTKNIVNTALRTTFRGGLNILARGIPEAIGSGAVQYGISGGNLQEAKDVGLISGAFSGGLGLVGDIAKNLIPKTVSENVARVLKNTGTKRLAQIGGKDEIDNAVGAFETIRKNAPNIKVKDINDVEKVFDPKKATFFELPQALDQTKKAIYNEYTKVASQAGDDGVLFGQKEFKELESSLKKYFGKGYTPQFSNKAVQFLNTISRYGTKNPLDGKVYYKNTSPLDIQQLIERVNLDVNPLGDKPGTHVANEFSSTIRKILDSKIEKSGNPNYQALRTSYSQLKSIEKDVIQRYKEALRKANANPNLIDNLTSLDAIMGVVRSEPTNIIRAGLFKSLTELGKYLRDPEINMRRAFKLLENPNLEKRGITETLGSRLMNNKEDKFFQKGEQAVKDYRALPNKEGGFIKNPLVNGKNVKTPQTYKGEKDLTTKILKDLEGKTTVSKQYILDATNRGELKQVERDLIRDIVNKEGDTVNVADFAKKVKAELLPLKAEKRVGKYENITLPEDTRGNVKNYHENIYQSPIKTSAGQTHFGGYGTGDKQKPIDSYFGHTRIEDMADNKTRRVIEVQSDLYQKGNLERETSEDAIDKVGVKAYDKSVGSLKDAVNAENEARQNRRVETAKLQQYNDPTAHFRMIREEIKKAAQDGKTKLQFPTGETAMKIEGLGENSDNWLLLNKNNQRLKTDTLKVGEPIARVGTQGDDWIITDVLGDGKFKAVPKPRRIKKIDGVDAYFYGDKAVSLENYKQQFAEQFDISGKVDTNNPIYKFYEKDVQKYLNKFGGKRIVDNKGVSWIEIPITKEQGKAPVEAFGKVQLSPLIGMGIASAGTVGGFDLLKRIKEKKEEKKSALPPKSEPIEKSNINREDFARKIELLENEALASKGKSSYHSVGETGDLGKYQLNPTTLKEWGKEWLNKPYTKEEFLNSPEAQEKFFKNFLDVVERLKLNEEQSALAWHMGWGALGDKLPREVRDKKFLKELEERKYSEVGQEYLRKFRKHNLFAKK